MRLQLKESAFDGLHFENSYFPWDKVYLLADVAGRFVCLNLADVAAADSLRCCVVGRLGYLHLMILVAFENANL